MLKKVCVDNIQFGIHYGLPSLFLRVPRQCAVAYSKAPLSQDAVGRTRFQVRLMSIARLHSCHDEVSCPNMTAYDQPLCCSDTHIAAIYYHINKQCIQG